jgi:hypothetical protein
MDMTEVAVVDAKSVAIPFDGLREALVVFAGFLGVAATFWLIGAFAGGVVLALIATFRVLYVASTLMISITRRRVVGMTVQEPLLVKFHAGEGYPAETCYLTAVRLGPQQLAKECPLFPVRMDNVFAKTDDAMQVLREVETQGVLAHPLNRKHLFVNDQISPAQRLDQLVRLAGWAGILAIGIFFVATG